MEYNHQSIEAKWRAYWQEQQSFKADNHSTKPKYYILDMFPYPSGAGLHVGHPLGYIATDIFSRYKRHKGFNVLHPMGFDSFGLPAEQYAIETGIHPAVSTAENIERYRSQMDNIGLSYDWSRAVTTSEPNYYKWTQHIFILLYGHFYDNTQQKARPIAELEAYFKLHGNLGLDAANAQDFDFSAAEWQAMPAAKQAEVLMNYRLAYRKLGHVNWCEALGTVLANDEVKDGVSERGGHPVVQRPMLQWSLRITAYAERLLQGLDTIDWPEALKIQQRNWIGRSEGATVFFPLQGGEANIEIFTTRPDTIFGATFMVLAPEHELVKQICSPTQSTEVEAYIAYASARTERERMADVKKVTGAFTGAYATNPFTGQPIPIWISDYVLAGYGTGAIMAVPSNDERDNRFAQQFNLPIIPVVDQSAFPKAEMEDKVGVMMNSGLLNGLPVVEAIATILNEIEQRKLGKRRVNFRFRDANFSRQRYWGEPFPILYDAEGQVHIDSALPVELPELDNYKPTEDGKAPLARNAAWVKHHPGFERETDTMPGFAGSSWYFLRYMDPNNDAEPFSQDAVNLWQEVDLYLGGSEHAVGHLLYARFWHKFLHDLNLVPTDEPFRKLINQGMIQGVIEYVLMMKNKRDGKSVFVSADMIGQYPDEEFAEIPVYIDFVSDYGSANSYLSAEGIEQFKAWRSDYAEAIFECNADGRLLTRSEVGKMSKRYFNVVNPDDVVAKYGADCFRLYEMFLGPLEMSKPWDMQSIEGTSKFLRRFWSLFFDKDQFLPQDVAPTKDELKALHACIKKVNDDVERFSLNTCVSAFMIAVNELKKLNCRSKQVLEELVVLISPFAPFVAEELWSKLGHSGSIETVAYPVHNDDYLKSDTITYPICINGKRRTELEFAADASPKDIEAAALASDQMTKWLEGFKVNKVIIVPGKMVNIVGQ